MIHEVSQVTRPTSEKHGGHLFFGLASYLVILSVLGSWLGLESYKQLRKKIKFELNKIKKKVVDHKCS